MNKLLLAVVLFLGCSPCHAAEKLSQSDMVGLGAIYATYYIDYRQTLDIKNHSGLHETNPFLGEHPKDREIKQYFVKAAIITYGAMYLCPPEYRKYLIGGVVTVEAVVIGKNKYLGLRTNF